MHIRNRTDADHMGEPEPSVGLLSYTRLAPQLKRNFGDLADAGRPKRMAHGDKATGRAHRTATANIERSLLEKGNIFTDPANAGRFGIEQFLDGEGIVQLDDVELVRRDSSLRNGAVHRHRTQARIRVQRVAETFAGTYR